MTTMKHEKKQDFLVKSLILLPPEGPPELLAGDAARRCGSRTCAGAMCTPGQLKFNDVLYHLTFLL